MIDPATFLRGLFFEAVAAVSADRCIPRHLPSRPRGRTIVVGAGKAAAAMAHAVEQRWDGPLSGLVVTRYGHSVPCARIEVIEAAHPVPDAAGRAAAARMLGMVQGLSADDLVLCLISGGGSALLAAPAAGITLEEKQQINRALLRSGANIAEMNCVRKHLSALKGGRLAVAAAPARVVTLAISDVPGDDPSVIASGPTVADATTFADARAILAKYRIDAPPAVSAHLQAASDETPKPGDPRLADSSVVICTTAQDALQAAARFAQAHGITPVVLGDSIEGEARDVALVHAGIARQVARHGGLATAPCVLLSGGETTVTVRGNGRGGRNTEFLLALALALNGARGLHALAADTDGIDGSEDNAGALLFDDSLARAGAQGIHARLALDDNDGYAFFAALGDLLKTGPTRTNVNDLRAILITASAASRT